jgi:MazG family protein
MPKRNKKRERGAESGTLRGLPHSLPSLEMAYRLQERAAGVGFDWPDTRGPLDKVKEELRELEGELTAERPAPRSPLPGIEEEVGDLLFAVVNLSRKLGLDPGAALKRANDKFIRRFAEVERLAAERGLEVGRASLEELDRLWEEVKRR